MMLEKKLQKDQAFSDKPKNVEGGDDIDQRKNAFKQRMTSGSFSHKKSGAFGAKKSSPAKDGQSPGDGSTRSSKFAQSSQKAMPTITEDSVTQDIQSPGMQPRTLLKNKTMAGSLLVRSPDKTQEPDLSRSEVRTLSVNTVKNEQNKPDGDEIESAGLSGISFKDLLLSKKKSQIKPLKKPEPLPEIECQPEAQANGTQPAQTNTFTAKLQEKLGLKGNEIKNDYKPEEIKADHQKESLPADSQAESKSTERDAVTELKVSSKPTAETEEKPLELQLENKIATESTPKQRISESSLKSDLKTDFWQTANTDATPESRFISKADNSMFASNNESHKGSTSLTSKIMEPAQRKSLFARALEEGHVMIDNRFDYKILPFVSSKLNVSDRLKSSLESFAFLQSSQNSSQLGAGTTRHSSKLSSHKKTASEYTSIRFLLPHSQQQAPSEHLESAPMSPQQSTVGTKQPQRRMSGSFYNRTTKPDIFHREALSKFGQSLIRSSLLKETRNDAKPDNSPRGETSNTHRLAEIFKLEEQSFVRGLSSMGTSMIKNPSKEEPNLKEFALSESFDSFRGTPDREHSGSEQSSTEIPALEESPRRRETEYSARKSTFAILRMDPEKFDKTSEEEEKKLEQPTEPVKSLAPSKTEAQTQNEISNQKKEGETKDSVEGQTPPQSENQVSAQSDIKANGSPQKGKKICLIFCITNFKIVQVQNFKKKFLTKQLSMKFHFEKKEEFSSFAISMQGKEIKEETRSPLKNELSLSRFKPQDDPTSKENLDSALNEEGKKEEENKVAEEEEEPDDIPPMVRSYSEGALKTFKSLSNRT